MLFFLSIIVSFNEFIYSFINIIFLCNCLNVVINYIFLIFVCFCELFINCLLFCLNYVILIFALSLCSVTVFVYNCILLV